MTQPLRIVATPGLVRALEAIGLLPPLNEQQRQRLRLEEVAAIGRPRLPTVPVEVLLPAATNVEAPRRRPVVERPAPKPHPRDPRPWFAT